MKDEEKNPFYIYICKPQDFFFGLLLVCAIGLKIN